MDEIEIFSWFLACLPVRGPYLPVLRHRVLHEVALEGAVFLWVPEAEKVHGVRDVEVEHGEEVVHVDVLGLPLVLHRHDAGSVAAADAPTAAKHRQTEADAERDIFDLEKFKIQMRSLLFCLLNCVSHLHFPVV